MMNNLFFSTIYELQKKISNYDINWVIIGSVGLIFQGVQIVPKDIDILTDKTGFYWFRDNYNFNLKNKFKYSKLEKSRSFFGSLKKNGIMIEVMAELENKFNDDWELHQGLSQKIHIQFNNIRIPVVPLPYEQYICEQLKRKDKALLIKKTINLTNKSKNTNDVNFLK